jgi:hypothetical protein
MLNFYGRGNQYEEKRYPRYDGIYRNRLNYGVVRNVVRRIILNFGKSSLKKVKKDSFECLTMKQVMFYYWF